jgi:hypothetical protein
MLESEAKDIPLHARSYQDAAAANTDSSEGCNGARDYGLPSRPRILSAYA